MKKLLIVIVVLILPFCVVAADNISPTVLEHRLTKLETKVDLKFDQLDQGITLARETLESQRKTAKADLDHRLEGMNEFQNRMDKLEGTFATKDELNALSRLVYIGIGMLLALQLAFQIVARKRSDQ